jgi:hypothetical protein
MNSLINILNSLPIFLKFIIGLYALFISPQIFINYYFRKSEITPFRIIYGLITSLTLCWLFIWFSVMFKINSYIIFVLSFIIAVISLIFLIKINIKLRDFILWIITFILLAGLFSEATGIFTHWDAVVSWNRWGIELSNNIYKPIAIAYPVLIPSIWAYIYKMQGTADIWWTAKFSLFFLYYIVLLFFVYSFVYFKKIKFGLYLMFATILVLIKFSMSGYMDVPVTIFSFVSLVLLDIAEEQKEKNYDLFYKSYFSSLILAGLASIIKAPGVILWLFVVLFGIFNYKYFIKSEIIRKLKIITFLSSLYYILYLFLFYKHEKEIVKTTIDVLNVLANLSSFKFNLNSIFFKLKSLFYISDYPTRGYQITGIIFFIILLLAFFIDKNIRKLKKFDSILLIFFFFNILLWLILFSYDGRNSIYTISIIGLFILRKISECNIIEKIKFKFFCNGKFKQRIFNKKITGIFLILFFIALFSVSSKVDNFYVYNRQKILQSKIGNEELAKYIVKLLNNKSNICVYVNDQPTVYNYLLNKYRIANKVIQFGGSDWRGFTNHNCEGGAYWIIYSEYISNIDKNNIENGLTNNKLIFVERIKAYDIYDIYYIPYKGFSK